MDDLNQLLVYLESNKARLLREYHLTRIGVFGSMARNEQNDTSDIDLIVEFENTTPDLYSIKQKLKAEFQNKFRRPVDICREKYLNPFFKKSVISEARYV